MMKAKNNEASSLISPVSRRDFRAALELIIEEAKTAGRDARKASALIAELDQRLHQEGAVRWRADKGFRCVTNFSLVESGNHSRAMTSIGVTSYAGFPLLGEFNPGGKLSIVRVLASSCQNSSHAVNRSFSAWFSLFIPRDRAISYPQQVSPH